MICLKFDDRDGAQKVLSACRRHNVSRGITWSAENLAIEATEEDVWQYLLSVDSAWKFCFRFDQRPELPFLPKVIAEYFPFDVDSYTQNAVFYVNFDALLQSLRLLLTPDDVSVRHWIQEVSWSEDFRNSQCAPPSATTPT
ncbi:hypothetical protein BOX15_Mlig034539g2 [Macrostomum lignano]|uniref:Uncharacterized protein n=1 Tax=Macrostomum lignano TaxID=282301 RepID=A0A267FSQ8_9PLAT|nr:hypothetical protein BOX15_Mlig034539g2 [Macrostomum lignano]